MALDERMADARAGRALPAKGKVCTRCVMDESDPAIAFDAAGMCSHCHTYDRFVRPQLLTDSQKRERLPQVVDRIKAAGRGHEYDCVLGLSGGADSSYVALNAARLGLRPLIVHFDNGWNSEAAVRNIESVVRTFGLDLVTHVVDWNEFRAVQLAFLRASVVDIEMITDHAINALVYRSALSHGLRWILTGQNLVTESILPSAWVHRKTDRRNLSAIARAGGVGSYESLPVASTLQVRWWMHVRRVQSVDLLEYLPYDRAEAIAELAAALGWQDYGGKHHESLFTRFYQAHLLPVKFGIDKRRAHLTTMILSGQITRDEALSRLALPLYDPVQLEIDREFVAKKWGLTVDELDRLLAEPPVPHLAFASDESLFRPLKLIRSVVRGR